MNGKLRNVLKRMLVIVFPVLFLSCYSVPCFAAPEGSTVEITQETREERSEEVTEETTEETEYEISKKRVKTADNNLAIQSLVITVVTGMSLLIIRKKMKMAE